MKVWNKLSKIFNKWKVIFPIPNSNFHKDTFFGRDIGALVLFICVIIKHNFPNLLSYRELHGFN